MINGLDLFSGIGGISLALSEWVKPIAYCEIDKYCQRVLQARFADGSLTDAPIWDDVTTLHGRDLPEQPDIVYGGFPCQDISCAGAGKGLAGERSGLFFEIVRMCSEIRPAFVFLENVSAITIRGADRVGAELAALGYDCRWTVVSAASVGAPHQRKRWWCLAYSNRPRRKAQPLELADRGREMGDNSEIGSSSGQMAYTYGQRCEHKPTRYTTVSEPQCEGEASKNCRRGWWSIEPDVARVVNGLPDRVDRVRALGNSVVPQCARQAFMYLMGLSGCAQASE